MTASWTAPRARKKRTQLLKLGSSVDGDAGYGLQRLEMAVAHLTSGEGDARTRLLEAVKDHLNFVHRRDIPDTLVERWDHIMAAFTGKGSIPRTLLRIRNSTARKIIEDIVILAEALRAELSSANSSGKVLAQLHSKNP
jgi:hypothetical protein